MDAIVEQLEERMTQLEERMTVYNELLLRLSEGTAKALEGFDARTGQATKRETVWLDAWLAVVDAWLAVGADINCVSPAKATVWANNCLRDFDAKFGGDK